MSKTVNLSTLKLPVGTHAITVKARARGYLDSDPSNTESYVVADSNDVPVKGRDAIVPDTYHLDE